RAAGRIVHAWISGRGHVGAGAAQRPPRDRTEARGALAVECARSAVRDQALLLLARRHRVPLQVVLTRLTGKRLGAGLDGARAVAGAASRQRDDTVVVNSAEALAQDRKST